MDDSQVNVWIVKGVPYGSLVSASSIVESDRMLGHMYVSDLKHHVFKDKTSLPSETSRIVIRT